VTALRAGVELRRPTTIVARLHAAVAPVWPAFLWSRLLVWIAGCGAVLAFGDGHRAVRQFDPTGLSWSFGRLGNLLAAPAVRWDSIYYIQIAAHGYSNARDTAFYPLYPLLIRIGSWLTGSLVVAGVLISLVALVTALVLIRWLTELELGEAAANAAVQLIAFAPLALFLSAVYTESLFLALSAGTFLAARRGRWAWAGILGAVSSVSRVGGGALLIPLVIMFLYGPRSDAPPRRTDAWWKPRYPLRADLLWLALIPAALSVFSAYLSSRGYGSSAPLHAQERYSGHRLTLPVVGAWDGVVAAFNQTRLLLSGVSPPLYQSQALLQLSSVVVALIGLVGIFRRLPFAYGAYVALELLIALASPTAGDPLRGFDRYACLRFPLFMWFGLWAVERRTKRGMIFATSMMLVFFTAQFATWHWVGSTPG
jgi:hypothetical protein